MTYLIINDLFCFMYLKYLYHYFRVFSGCYVNHCRTTSYATSQQSCTFCLLPTLIPKHDDKFLPQKSRSWAYIWCNTYLPDQISVATVAWKLWNNLQNFYWIWGLFLRENFELGSVHLVKNLCLGRFEALC